MRVMAREFVKRGEEKMKSKKEKGERIEVGKEEEEVKREKK